MKNEVVFANPEQVEARIESAKQFIETNEHLYDHSSYKLKEDVKKEHIPTELAAEHSHILKLAGEYLI